MNPEEDLLLSSLIGIQSCYREITLSPSQMRDNEHHIAWIGQQAVEIHPEMIAYEIIVRNDIYEDKIVEITEQLTLTYSAKVMKHLPSHNLVDTSPKSPMIHVFNDASTETKKVWNEILIVIGCNLSFERVVFLLFTPPGNAFTGSGAQNKGSSSYNSNNLMRKTISSIINRNGEFVSFCSRAISHFTEAFFTENITVFNEVVSKNLDRTLPAYSQYICEGILDLSFIRDLQLATSQIMNSKISKEVNYLDTQVLKLNEMKCAKIMTLLKPYYQKAGISLPVVPTSRSLTSYPLTLSRETIKEPSLEGCRLLLLKARKNYRVFVTAESKKIPAPTEISIDYLSHEYQVAFLTKDIIAQLSEWSEEEYGLRMNRKLASVRDRLEQLQQFKIQLILTLHNRFVENNVNSIQQYAEQLAGKGSGLAAAASSLWSFSSWNTTSSDPTAGNLPAILSTSDYLLHVSLRERFAFLDVDEPIIVECQGFISQSEHNLSGGVSNSNNEKASNADNHSTETAAAPRSEPTPVSSRKGTFYFTIGNLMFYSVSTLLYNPIIVVIPMRIIRQVELWKNGKLLFSKSFSSTGPSPSSASALTSSNQAETENNPPDQEEAQSRPLVLPLSALSGTVSVISPTSPSTEASSSLILDEAIVITDVSGRQTILKFSELTPDYVFRIYDLLELLLQEKLFDLRYKPKRTTTVAASNTTSSSQAINTPSISELQINQEIEKLEEMISSHQLSIHSSENKHDVSNESDRPFDENLLEFEEQNEIVKLSEFFAGNEDVPAIPPPVNLENNPELSQTQLDRSVSSSASQEPEQMQAGTPNALPEESKTSKKTKPNLAGGIQKFLSQSQNKRKTSAAATNEHQFSADI